MAKTRKEYNAYMRDYMRKRWHERRAQLIEQMGGKCVRCGGTDRLQFDHKDRATRSFVIAHGASFSDERIQDELKKCQLLCMKCHQDKTFAELGFKRAKGTHGTISSYRYCRCSLCRAAKAAYLRRSRARKRAQQNSVP